MSLILIKYEIFPAGSPAMFPKFNCKSYFTLVDGEERVEFFKLWYLSLEIFFRMIVKFNKIKKTAPNVEPDDTYKSFFYNCLFESQYNYPDLTHAHFNIFPSLHTSGGKQMSYFTQFCARFVRVI